MKGLTNSKQIAVLALAMLMLMGCSPPRKVAVEERKTVDWRQGMEELGGTHIRIVQPGDTLYAIAFANRLDPQQLAAWNKIGDTNKLAVGRRLRLTKPLGFVMPKETRAAPTKRLPAADRVANKPPKPKQKPAAAHRSARSGATANPTVVAAATAIPWRWPTAGSVVRSFAIASGQQGIDIQGQRGQPVIATGAGEVVYVGNGLRGYGNLVILKHSDQYISAYAHNLETFVQEGQWVNDGVRIAALGQNQRGQDALHFQIRKNGVPVDPLRFLQKN